MRRSGPSDIEGDESDLTRTGILEKGIPKYVFRQKVIDRSYWHLGSNFAF
jgi:hypothetical protein